MLHQILATTIKDLKLMQNDLSALALLFMMPLVFILLMSLALANLFDGDGGPPVTIMLVNEDQGTIGAQVFTDLKQADGFTVMTTWEDQPLTRMQAEALIIGGSQPIAVVIPAGFSEAVSAAVFGESSNAPSGEIILISDPALSTQILMPVQGAMSGLSQQAVSQAIAPQGMALLLDTIEQQGGSIPGEAREHSLEVITEGNASGDPLVSLNNQSPAGMQTVRRPNAVEQNVPGYTLFGVFFITQMLAGSMMEEQRSGTFRRLLSAPLPRWALLLGKLLAFFLINLIQIVLMFAVGIFVLPLFGAPALGLGEHPLALIPVAIAVSLAANGLGLLIAALSSTAEQASGMALLFILPMAVLGGVMAPRFIMPPMLQTIGLASPHTWALQGFQDVIMRGANFSGIMLETTVLLLFAVVFFSLALWRLRWV